ncbi:MAG: pitrilysin family protein [Pseudomonadota bacterium]
MKHLILSFAALILLALPARAEVDIEEVTSPGGITAWLVQEPSIPFTALHIRFRGGATLDREGKRGAMNLMTGLLEEGAGDLDARAFAREMESLAASFSYSVRDDALSIQARFLTENRDDAVALLRSSIKAPRFDPDAIDRVREQVLSGIRSDAVDPNEIATRTWRSMAFGDHPYGSALSGTEQSVTALTRADLLAAHGDIFAKDRMYVGAVGDITPEELGTLLDTLLGDLPETGAPMPEAAVVGIAGGITVVPMDVPQSVAVFGHAGIEQDDDDSFAARVLNQVLGGGGFQSRLTQEVRVERGLTYGVYSFLVPRDLAATYQGQVASANDRIAEAIDVIRAEWARAAAEGVTAEELEAAKTYMTGSYPLQFDGNGTIARIMVGMQMLGLPVDYIATRNEKVDAVTLEDVQRVAASLLDPDGLHFVVVGQPEGLSTGPLPN